MGFDFEIKTAKQSGDGGGSHWDKRFSALVEYSKKNGEYLL
jgi:hypothetical protein